MTLPDSIVIFFRDGHGGIRPTIAELNVNYISEYHRENRGNRFFFCIYYLYNKEKGGN